MIEKTFDELIVERLKHAALGRPYSNGQPASRFDQLLAQGALTARAVERFSGTSLYALVNGLHTEAELHDSKRTAMLGWHMHLPGGVVDTYHSAVTVDIASGRLPVREPLTFLRCNDLPEIKLLPDLDPGGLDAMAIMVRYAVKKTEAIEWLAWHGIDAPSWPGWPAVRLEGDDSPGAGEVSEQVSAERAVTKRWSECFGSGKLKLRLMIDVIQLEIEGRGYVPTCIPHGGKALIESACTDANNKLFNRPTSFENAWRELVDIGKVRSYNHVAYAAKSGLKIR